MFWIDNWWHFLSTSKKAPFWQFFKKGWDGRALLVQPSKTHHSHSVLEQIYTKFSYPEQRLPQHESLYPIGLISAQIKILHIVNSFTK